MTREEAIEAVRNIYQTDKEKEALETLIPEFKGNEDERIRNRIISYLKQDIEEYPERKERIEDMLAYLEKQKEPINHTESYMKGFSDGCEAERESYRVSDEQKPAEWSDGEMKVLDSIIDDYEKTAKSFCGYDGKIGLLKAIRDSEYDLPKQKWSEEDENTITTAIRACRYMTENFENSTKQYEDAIERLKSFRPSWKPSEEQPEVDLEHIENEAELIANKIMIGVQANKYHTCIYNTERNDFNHSHLVQAARKGIEFGLNARNK